MNSLKHVLCWFCLVLQNYEGSNSSGKDYHNCKEAWSHICTNTVATLCIALNDMHAWNCVVQEEWADTDHCLPNHWWWSFMEKVRTKGYLEFSIPQVIIVLLSCSIFQGKIFPHLIYIYAQNVLSLSIDIKNIILKKNDFNRLFGCMNTTTFLNHTKSWN